MLSCTSPIKLHGVFLGHCIENAPRQFSDKIHRINEIQVKITKEQKIMKQIIHALFAGLLLFAVAETGFSTANKLPEPNRFIVYKEGEAQKKTTTPT
jgi:hypothetical protein